MYQARSSTGISVTFYGAAQTVTGSMHLLETPDARILLDCGLMLGHRDDVHLRNRQFPFAPSWIDAVLLSHAHIDHCGNLPNLVRQGFTGPIYCTPATRDLMAIMLADSGKIQEEDAEYLNSQRPKGEPPTQPLYTRQDASRTASQCDSIPYDRPGEVSPGVQVRFVDAGHLLGSAMVALKIQNSAAEHTITFTGDLGRRGLPILRDPAPVPPAELLISESTYGGRTHPPVEELADGLADVVKRTFDRGGKVIIPAFSLGRTQTVVLYLHQLIQSGRLPETAIFVDSPLAAKATEV